MIPEDPTEDDVNAALAQCTKHRSYAIMAQGRDDLWAAWMAISTFEIVEAAKEVGKPAFTKEQGFYVLE